MTDISLTNLKELAEIILKHLCVLSDKSQRIHIVSEDWRKENGFFSFKKVKKEDLGGYIPVKNDSWQNSGTDY